MTPKQLIAWRQRLDLTVEEAAALLGVHRRTVYKWEHDERAISPLAERVIHLIEHVPGVRAYLERLV